MAFCEASTLSETGTPGWQVFEAMPVVPGQRVTTWTTPVVGENGVLTERTLDRNDLVAQGRVVLQEVVQAPVPGSRIVKRRVGRGELVAQGRIMEEEVVREVVIDTVVDPPVVEKVPFQDRQVMSERPIGREELLKTGNFCIDRRLKEVEEAAVGPFVDVRRVRVDELKAMPKISLQEFGTDWKPDIELERRPGQLQRFASFQEIARGRPVVTPPVRPEGVWIRPAKDFPVSHSAPYRLTPRLEETISSIPGALSSLRAYDVQCAPSEAWTVSSFPGTLSSVQTFGAPTEFSSALRR